MKSPHRFTQLGRASQSRQRQSQSTMLPLSRIRDVITSRELSTNQEVVPPQLSKNISSVTCRIAVATFLLCAKTHNSPAGASEAARIMDVGAGKVVVDTNFGAVAANEAGNEMTLRSQLRDRMSLPHSELLTGGEGGEGISM